MAATTGERGGGTGGSGGGGGGEGARFLHEKYTCRVFDNALSRDVFALCQGQAGKLSDCPNYWVPREALPADGDAAGELEPAGKGPPAPRCMGEIASADLYRRVLRKVLNENKSAAGRHAWFSPENQKEGEEGEGEATVCSSRGCEYWTQVYHGGRGLQFHFDKDEAKVKSKGIFSFPILSCVIYLTDGAKQRQAGGEKADAGAEAEAEAEAIIGAQSPTIVVDQVYGDDGRQPRKSVLSYPKENRVLVFDGRLAHGVLDSMNEVTRKSLLVNFWEERPEAVLPVTSEDVAKHGLFEDKAEDKAEECVAAVEQALELRTIGAEGAEVVLLDDVRPSAAARCCAVSHASHVLYPIERSEGVSVLGAFCLDDED